MDVGGGSSSLKLPIAGSEMMELRILQSENIDNHERTTTAKNMGIHKYHPTSLISYERGWPLACLEDLIKPNQASNQGAR
jgi:hypothetical protein